MNYKLKDYEIKLKEERKMQRLKKNGIKSERR